ncbi:lysocardiolipin acyltransferase 1 isoform X4 [Orcinus orca]|uniref:lysocardiolipin acyltransferase 1 isoform X4 n=1 Tax=Orcinus orca TaxID=9733 RepID=UPI002111F500|nr:lysocardiolipin acyltransferase 1 isoform X4 [Orcinus orca]
MVSWRGIYFILTLFWGSFFGSIFMLGPFLPLMFINPSWYRWINNRLVATWLTLPVALLETMFGVKVIITGDAFVPGERSVIIMNHRTRMDWMFLWNCLMRYSYLRLEKICLKATLKRVPGFGWAMQAAAYIFIHRKWKDDKSHFEDMIDYFCDIHEPLQLLIFPEGTDLTENSTARSNEFAEKNGLQKYEYVLHPRTTGFTFVVDRLREVRGPLTAVASPVAEHRLRTHRLSGHGSRAQPLRGMWDPPGPGHEPVSPASAGGLSTTAPPGKPGSHFFISLFIMFLHFKVGSPSTSSFPPGF